MRRLLVGKLIELIAWTHTGALHVYLGRLSVSDG